MEQITKETTIQCLNCHYEGPPGHGRNVWTEIMLVIFFWWMLLIPLSFYHHHTPKWICPRCGNKNIIKT